MARLRITDSKGFGISFANGWAVSVQFGYGNYCDNYNGHGTADVDHRERQRLMGEQGSSNAECAVFDPSGEMVKLPAFMFDNPEYADVVSNRSTPDQVLRLMNWAAEQPKGERT